MKVLGGLKSRSILVLLIILAAALVAGAQPAAATPPAADPVYVVETGEVVFADSLASDTGQWATGPNADRSLTASFQDGALHIVSDGKGAFLSLAAGQFEDFVVEVSVRKVKGADPASYGLWFRGSAGARGYVLRLSSTGDYIIDRSLGGGRFVTLREGTHSAVRQGNRANTAKVVAVGGLLGFYVNGAQIAVLRDDDGPARGQFGLWAQGSERGLDIEFSNLTAWGVSSFQESGPDRAAEVDWNIPNGWFSTQAGDGLGEGFAVTDDGGVRFWEAFQDSGGVTALGYPISWRYVSDDGFVYQAFQQGVLQWRPSGNQVFLIGPQTSDQGDKDAWVALPPDSPYARIDPGLRAAMDTLYRSKAGRPLADAIQDHGVPVVFAQIKDDPKVEARFAYRVRAGSVTSATVIVSTSLHGKSPGTLAALLAHEASHARTAFSRTQPSGAPPSCVDNEQEAYRAAALFWRELYGPSGKQPAIDDTERDQNAISRDLDTPAFERWLQNVCKDK